MTGASTFAERSLARALARDAKRARKQAQPQPPLADWCEPGEILCLRPEPCRKYPGRLLVGYILDRNGDCHGWRTRPLGPCGRPDRCGEKVHGITPAEAFGWSA